MRAKAADSKHVTVRMYNVGFGDAFLVSFPAADRARWVLVDCGVHPSGPGPRKMKDVVGDVIADVTRDNKARLDVVVATHRHADHVKGFDDKRWEKVDVGEVWLPWTENPKDAKGREILEKQSKSALMLSELQGISPEVKALADNQLVNAKAMATLKTGFAGTPERRYLPARQPNSATFTTQALPGVTIHVLGPSFDPEVIRDMEPAEGEAFLRAMAASNGDPHARFEPFGSPWKHVLDDLPNHVREIADRDRERIREIDRLDPLAVAVALEKAVNGTSLVLMFEIGGQFLLFTGDAQWGTWKAIYENDDTRALVAKTTFYKVGHHGSHNATLPEVVDVLGDFVGCCSTRHPTLQWDIPRPPLLEEMRKKSPVIRSDTEDVADPDGVTRDDNNHYVDLSLDL